MNCEINVSNSRRLEPSVDWLTATTDDEKSGFAWYSIMQRYQRMLENKTERSVPVNTNRKWRQYVGVEVGGFYWGQSEKHGWIAIVKGDTAAVLWQEIAPVAKRVTRLDLAVTVDLENRDEFLARTSYNSANDGRKVPRYTMWESQSGQTLYVGSRQSNYYGRLYDKGGQLGGERGVTWRYEIEMKDDLKNLPHTKYLYDKWKSDGPVGSIIAGYVWYWFYTRGVTPVFRLNDMESQMIVDIELRVDSVDRSLRWLRTQVAPTLSRLGELGYGQESLLALGLTAEQLPMWTSQ